MDSGWQNTLLGGVLAVAGGFASAWFQAKVTRGNEARQLAMSFKGELSAIVDIAEARQYEAGLVNAIRLVEETGLPIIVAVPVKREYTIVYTQNASKIGLLKGDLPTKIATVYTKLSAILEDFAFLNEVNNAPERRNGWGPASCLEMYRELLPLMQDTLGLARSIISDIDETYPRRWMRRK